MEKDKQQSTTDNLVTIAIHTYEKAYILQSILESEGIPAAVHGVNIIQPVMRGNLRVRINENDLPRALEIIENLDLSSYVEDYKDYNEKPEKKLIDINHEILIPVDFSDYSLTACEFGFRLAEDLNCKAKLFHAFFLPSYPATAAFGEAFPLSMSDKKLYQSLKKNMEEEMKKLTDKIEKEIISGKLPKIEYSTVLVKGLPEEEIIEYSKTKRPTAIVMGTRGRHAKELDLIGSVTAEVIEGCRTPIFAVPERTSADLSEMKNVVFLTNFQVREFKAFDIMMKFLSPYPIKIYLAHIAKKEDVWNEIKLSGLQKHLAEQYPNLQTEYKLIDHTEGLEMALEKFVHKYNIDMISLSSSRRNIFARMFNPGIARRMLFHSDMPMLVIKGMEG
jgi:nucleotide-binding universal stress UspA family protein